MEVDEQLLGNSGRLLVALLNLAMEGLIVVQLIFIVDKMKEIVILTIIAKQD